MSYGQQNPYGQSQGNTYGQQQSNPYGQQQSNPYGQQQSNPYGQQQSSPYGQQQSTTYGQQSSHYDRNDSYGQYGGNPYGNEQEQRNPYGQEGGLAPQQPALHHQGSNYSQSDYGSPPVSQQPTQQLGAPQQSTYVAPVQRGQPMSNQAFLTRVDAVKTEINNLTQQIASIASIHQRVFSSPDSNASAQLESVTTQTQVLNERIKDEIRALEVDAKRSGSNATKDTQVRSLKNSFKQQLESFKKEELEYGSKYRDQIKRQYKIVNPDATEEEVQEAADADWGNEGVFQTALKSNRSGHASSVLGAVRARHRDIQQIEKTLIELNQMFVDLAEAVVIQEPAVQAAEQQTEAVKGDTEAANVQLTKGIKSARNARKLKWWCLGITVLIIIILGLVLGLYFGLQHTGGK